MLEFEVEEAEWQAQGNTHTHTHTHKGMRMHACRHSQRHTEKTCMGTFGHSHMHRRLHAPSPPHTDCPPPPPHTHTIQAHTSTTIMTTDALVPPAMPYTDPNMPIAHLPASQPHPTPPSACVHAPSLFTSSMSKSKKIKTLTPYPPKKTATTTPACVHAPSLFTSIMLMSSKMVLIPQGRLASLRAAYSSLASRVRLPSSSTWQQVHACEGWVGGCM